MPDRHVITVVYRVDGTTKNASFTADAASITMLTDGGRTVVDLVGGEDDRGPVSAVMFRRAEMVVRRPVKHLLDKPQGYACEHVNVTMPAETLVGVCPAGCTMRPVFGPEDIGMPDARAVARG